MSERSTAPAWMQAVDAVVDAGMIPVRLPGGLVGAKFPERDDPRDDESWPARATSEQRANLIHVCQLVRQATDALDEPAVVDLWRAATETLKALTDYADRETK